MGVTVSIYHDRRRKLKDGLYPVKIRVHSDIGHKAKFYNPLKNKIRLSIQDFDRMMANKVKDKLRDLKMYLDATVARYYDDASQIEVFDFKTFEFKIGRDQSRSLCVFEMFESRIQKMKENGQVGTYESYISAMQSFKRFAEQNENNSANHLPFKSITPIWLEKYEHWMHNIHGKSLNSVSIYTRNLRAVFNEAIKEKLIRPEVYPFGRDKYEIPSTTKLKKALTESELETLINSTPINEFEQKAKDLWLICYFLQGINVRDLVEIKLGQIQNEILSYYRTKITTRRRTAKKPVIVYLSPQAWIILRKYMRKNIKSDDYIFDFIKEGQSPEEIRDVTKKLTRYVNEHIQNFATRIGINPEISTNVARHTFATKLITSGGGIEMAMELLSHSSIKVTEGYFAGFADEVKRNFIKKIFGDNNQPISEQ